MIRFILSAIYVFFFLILSLPVTGVLWIACKFNKKKADLAVLRFVQWGFKCVIFICGTKVEYIGMENIPKNQAVLYIGNHRGFFDIITTYSRMPDLTGYVAKDIILKVPVLSMVMKKVYCVFMPRDDIKGSLNVILKMSEYMKQGISMFIFPEGHRNKSEKDWELLPMHNGSFKPAQRAKCPIIPVAITNADKVFERQFPKVKVEKMIVRFGKPVYMSDLDEDQKKHIGDTFSGMLSDMLKENEKLLTTD